MFENNNSFSRYRKINGKGWVSVTGLFVWFVSSVAEKVAFPAFDGIFEAETETGEYPRITRWPTRDQCECSPNHECMLNSAIHRQFLRSDVV
jgi:hypothetical protein